MYLLVFALFLISCSPDTSFEGNTESSGEVTSQKKESIQTTFDDDLKINDSEDGIIIDSEDGIIIDGPQISREEYNQNCWFAVSGLRIGVNSEFSQGIFPDTLDGQPIRHNSKFQVRGGGVYLQARDTPYVYEQGDRELDDAINLTFDTIAVAPGMSFEIKNENNETIFSGEGPIIAMSQKLVDSLPASIDRLGEYTNDLKNNPKLPSWMKQIVDANEIQVGFLNKGRSVLVEAVPGKQCGNITD